MAYKHGIYVMEQATETAAARVSAAGLKVVVGTAPVWALKQPVVNEPVLVNSYEEAVEKMGWCESWRDYTLCKEVKAQFSLFTSTSGASPNRLNCAFTSLHSV